MNTSVFASSIAVAALMLGVAGCAPKESPAPKAAASAATDAAMPPKSGAVVASMGALPKLGAAPAWTLPDLAGKPVNFEQFKGKVVVVDFWATWCPPCRAEIPGYTELQAKYGNDGFVIIGISLDQAGPEVVKAFGEKYKINYPLVMGDDRVVAAFGGVEGIPTTFLIDRNGQIRDRKVGAEEKEEYEKKIAAVMGEKA